MLTQVLTFITWMKEIITLVKPDFGPHLLNEGHFYPYPGFALHKLIEGHFPLLTQKNRLRSREACPFNIQQLLKVFFLQQGLLLHKPKVIRL